MNDLADRVAAVLADYESGHARRLLESPQWLEVRRQTKELASELEVRGYAVAAGRVDREYTRLADALRSAASKEQPPPIKDDFVLHDISHEFQLTLRALERFRQEIDRQKARRYEGEAPVETLPSPGEAQAAWTTAPAETEGAAEEGEADADGDGDEDNRGSSGGAAQWDKPRVDPDDPRLVHWFRKRLYLGGEDTLASQVFWMLATRMNYPVPVSEIQRAIEGIETSRASGASPQEITRANNRLRKTISRLRAALREHGLDAHVTIVRESEREWPCYTMAYRSRPTWPGRNTNPSVPPAPGRSAAQRLGGRHQREP